MKSLLTNIALVVLCSLIACTDERDARTDLASKTKNVAQTKYKRLWGKPSEDWVGKRIKIKFSKSGGRSLRSLETIVTLVEVKKDEDGYLYFKTEHPFTPKGHQELYFEWFGAGNWLLQIISVEEEIGRIAPKN